MHGSVPRSLARTALRDLPPLYAASVPPFYTTQYIIRCPRTSHSPPLALAQYRTYAASVPDRA
eukprot:3924240-Rhodomonas_salina.2